MKKIGLIVGVDADIPDNLIKRFGITTFPFVINWDEYNGKSNIYKLMRKATEGGPKTSQPAPALLYKLFSDKLKKFDQIIVITVSSKFSGTYNSAIQAVKMFSRKDRMRIHLVDSESSSGAEALLVLKVAKLIADDTNIDLILAEAKGQVKKINLVGVFEDPKWLVAGGRISAIKGILVRNMLKGGFRPVLTIRGGEIVVKKIQANAKNSVQALFSQFQEEVGSDKKVSVVITHADAEKQAKKLYTLLAKSSQSIKIEYVHEISPVVGSHLGPDTLLLSWADR